MRKPRISRAVKVVGFLSLLVVTGISPAMATSHSATSPDGGTHAYSSTAGGTFYVADTKCDNDSVHGNYYLTTGAYNSLANSSGCNTTVQKGVGGTVALVQACTNYGILPDNCSSFH